jgi:hypothetical protein
MVVTAVAGFSLQQTRRSDLTSLSGPRSMAMIDDLIRRSCSGSRPCRGRRAPDASVGRSLPCGSRVVVDVVVDGTGADFAQT